MQVLPLFLVPRIVVVRVRVCIWTSHDFWLLLSDIRRHAVLNKFFLSLREFSLHDPALKGPIYGIRSTPWTVNVGNLLFLRIGASSRPRRAAMPNPVEHRCQSWASTHKDEKRRESSWRREQGKSLVRESHKCAILPGMSARTSWKTPICAHGCGRRTRRAVPLTHKSLSF